MEKELINESEKQKFLDKLAMLRKLAEYANKGYTISRNYNMASDIEEMKCEYQRLKTGESMKQFYSNINKLVYFLNNKIKDACIEESIKIRIKDMDEGEIEIIENNEKVIDNIKLGINLNIDSLNILKDKLKEKGYCAKSFVPYIDGSYLYFGNISRV